VNASELPGIELIAQIGNASRTMFCGQSCAGSSNIQLLDPAACFNRNNRRSVSSDSFQIADSVPHGMSPPLSFSY
jgi:hypothetical protein